MVIFLVWGGSACSGLLSCVGNGWCGVVWCGVDVVEGCCSGMDRDGITGGRLIVVEEEY